MSAPNPKFPKKSIEVVSTHSNTSTELIEITSDKLLNILNEHMKKLEKANEWQTALGILLATVGALVTTEFKSTFGVEAGVWKAVFILTSALSVAWLIKAIIRAVRVESVEKLLRRIKNEA